MDQRVAGPGTLAWTRQTTGLVAEPVAAALRGRAGTAGVLAAPIDADLADTAAFCEHYAVSLADSANCVVITGKRDGAVRYAACVVLASTRADVNGVVRRQMDVRKATFAPMAEAVELTGMEYGGITPVGLPAGWPILVDRAVTERDVVVIGSGLRRSKLALAPAVLTVLPGAKVIDGLAR